MEARLQGCTTCHGQRGQGTDNAYFPRLAGKPAGYLYNQLLAFRDGTRKYAPMNYLVAYMPDAYLREMAEHFARERPDFTAPAAPSQKPGEAERGATLALLGDPTRQIPACTACHGAALTGMEPGIPALVGLRSNYLAAQLTRWRSKERHAASPDCMQRVASRLTDGDIASVASWLASRSAPADPSPLARNAVRLPLACGSQS
ncbi:MAG: c-type cytochrome [Pseudomonadota bacterium]